MRLKPKTLEKFKKFENSIWGMLLGIILGFILMPFVAPYALIQMMSQKPRKYKK